MVAPKKTNSKNVKNHTINKKGIINIGGKIQSVYNFAKEHNPNVEKIKAPKRNKLPLNQSMNVNKLNKIIKI